MELFRKTAFLPADILLPKQADMKKWSVVACDQYTSQPDYWKRVEALVGDAPSTLHITFPEVYLEAGDPQQRIDAINQTMARYRQDGLFACYPNSFIYVERTVTGGHVRKGLVGMVDLECYDYHKGAASLIRATEGTVLERIPPRVKIREHAPLELPHVMLLIDDPDCTVIEPLAHQQLQTVYDFDLMEQSGHIKGSLVPAQTSIAEALNQLCQRQNTEAPLLFAVGDGNHSLATAKECWERIKPTLSPQEQQDHPARYALAELVNIHDASLEFEPIHRVVFGCDPADLLSNLLGYFPGAQVGEHPGQQLQYVYGQNSGTVSVPTPPSELEVGTLQQFLDDYCALKGCKVDYIHGADVVKELSAAPNAMGFLLPAMDKSQLFPAVMADGALPRKTFSMGEAQDKRFYLECRSITK